MEGCDADTAAVPAFELVFFEGLDRNSAKEGIWKERRPLPERDPMEASSGGLCQVDMKAFEVEMVLRDDSGRIIDCNMRRFQGWCQP